MLRLVAFKMLFDKTQERKFFHAKLSPDGEISLCTVDFCLNKLRVYYISRSYSIVSEPNPKINEKCVETSECLDGNFSLEKEKKTRNNFCISLDNKIRSFCFEPIVR